MLAEVKFTSSIKIIPLFGSFGFRSDPTTKGNCDRNVTRNTGRNMESMYVIVSALNDFYN